MAGKTDIAQTSISAGQQMEFWRLALKPNSHVNAKTFQAFLEARNPFENFVSPDNFMADSFERFNIKPDGSFQVRVAVNRRLSAYGTFKAITNHRQSQNDIDFILGHMPLGEGREVVLHFFPLKKWMNCQEYEHELQRRNLKSDPMAQAAYNEKYDTFSKEHPNICQWEKDGKFYNANWRVEANGPEVNVLQDSYGLGNDWFGCGIHISD